LWQTSDVPEIGEENKDSTNCDQKEEKNLCATNKTKCQHINAQSKRAYNMLLLLLLLSHLKNGIFVIFSVSLDSYGSSTSDPVT